MYAGQSAPQRPKPDFGETTRGIAAPVLGEFTLEGGQRSWPVKRKTVFLGRKDNVTGIAPEVDLGEADPSYSVSRLHARLVLEANGFRLFEELGVKNGTLINGNRLVPGVAFALNDGDQVHIGLVPLRFVDRSGKP